MASRELLSWTVRRKTCSSYLVQAPVTMIENKQKQAARSHESGTRTGGWPNACSSSLRCSWRLRLLAVRLVVVFGLVAQGFTQSSVFSATQDSAIVKDAALVIVNATVHTMTGPVLENGRIVVRGDLIEAVGDENLPLPENAKIIDAKGLAVTPGWIDVNSQLWMSDAVGDAGSNDGSLLATDSLDPFAEDWADVLNAGVTTVYVQPSSAVQ